jgi:muconolactone D-isomerase
MPRNQGGEPEGRGKGDGAAPAARRHLWRIAGRYANVSIFDVESPQQLHDLLSQLPLFPYMDVEVRALCRHPSSIHDDDR